MRTSLCVRAVAAAAFAFVGYTASSSVSSGVLGIASAEAAQFYSRKRVNGVWVTGRFPKSGASRASFSRRTIRYGRRSAPKVAGVPASAELAALSLPDLRREPGPTTTGSTGAAAAATGAIPATAVLPDIEAALVTAAVGPVAPAGAPAAEEPGVALRRALEKRADEIAARIEPQPAVANVDPAVTAIRQPASTVEGFPAPNMTAAPVASAGSRSPEPPGPAAVSARDDAKAAALVPRSVSFDFETGIKTTVFESSVVREPFDIGAIRGLTARPFSAR